MKKIAPLALLAGLLLTLMFSLATAAVSGHNTETGEAINLSGWKAIYVYIAQQGLDSYLLHLLPVFVAFSAILIVSGRMLMKKRQQTAQ